MNVEYNTQKPWDYQGVAVSGNWLAFCHKQRNVVALKELFDVQENDIHKYSCDVDSVAFISQAKNILGVAFSPFNDNLLATCSEEPTIKLWHLPENNKKKKELFGRIGIADKSSQTLIGHEARVNSLEYHPNVENLLASASADSTMRIWDIETAKNLFHHKYDKFVSSLSWNYQGNSLCCSVGFTNSYFLDPRQSMLHPEEIISEGKIKKAIFMGKHNEMVLTTGFCEKGKRNIQIFDIRKMKGPVFYSSLDPGTFHQGSWSIKPIYDADDDLLFLVTPGSVKGINMTSHCSEIF